MTTDPFAQYHSPYLAMGNNPINMIDPTGGIAWDCIVEAILKALTQASKFVATNANSITSLISIAAQGSVASLVGGIDTGSPSGNPNIFDQRIDKTSFNFQKSTTNWHVAIVQPLIFWFDMPAGPSTPELHKKVAFSIEVGIAVRPNEDFNPDFAAQESANAANLASEYTRAAFNGIDVFRPGFDEAVKKMFGRSMENFLKAELPGSRVNVPPITTGIVPHPPVYKTFWNRFFNN
jgi:hypothetical protein